MEPEDKKPATGDQEQNNGVSGGTGTQNNPKGQGDPDPADKHHQENEEAKKRRLQARALKDELAETNKNLAALKAGLDAERDARQKAEQRAIANAKKAAAAKYGLPAEIAERLQGTTEEEIEADAEKLAKVLPQPSSAQNGGGKQPSAGNPSKGVELTMDEIKAMKPDQINARWDEVQRVLAAQK